MRIRTACKLVVTDDFAYAITGGLAEGLAFINRGLDLDELKLKSTTVLAMDLRTGKCVAYEEPGFPIPIEDKMYVAGSGGDIALGAMAFGASPEEAVKIASEWDVDTGLGVQVVLSDPAKKRLS